MNKYLLLLACGILAVSLLSSCGDNPKEEGRQIDAYTRGVNDGMKMGMQKGAGKAIEALKKKSSKIRKGAVATISSRMTFGAIIIVLSTLFGSVVIYKLRVRFSKWFHIPLKVQVAGIISIYCALNIFCLIWICMHYSLNMNVPILIFMSGIIYPFWNGYIPALKEGDKMLQRLNMVKIKSLGFMVLVMVLVYYILGKGIEGVL